MKAFTLLIILIIAISIRQITESYEIPYIVLIVYVLVNSIWSLSERRDK
jgi:hypothetical protein